MNEYWKNHFDLNAEIHRDSPLKQVDSTLNGRETDQSQINLMIQAIIRNLSISESDTVLDICCGNGLLTEQIAKLSKNVIGVDFSEKLINNARLASIQSNIEYLVADVAALDSGIVACASKIFMQDSIQYLNMDGFLKLLSAVNKIPQFDLFFVAGIPDSGKLKIYYNTDEKMAFYKKRENEGKPHMGTWWSKHEITSLAENAGLKPTFISQNPSLHTSYYRYDCLLQKE